MKIAMRDSIAPWIRRRIRQYLWKQWKTGANRKHRLSELGVEDWRLKKLGKATSNSYWNMSGIMGYLLTNNIIEERFGLIRIEDTWNELHKKWMKADKQALGSKQLVLDFI